MKKISFLSLLITAAAASLFLSNCKDGETVDPKPVLEFIGGSEYVAGDISLPGNEPFTVGLNASHTANIQTLKITVSLNGGAQLVPDLCTLCDTTFGSKSFRVDFDGMTGPTEGTEVWTFTIADKDGNATSKSITITNLGTGGATLVEIDEDNNGETLKVFNFLGPNSGAYDLKVGVNRFSADDNSTKDIQDSVSTADGTSWKGRWTSRAGSTFKKLGGTYTWGNITNTSQLDAAWNAGGTELSTFVVADGDLYVVNLRGTGEYVLVEVTDVVTTSNDNQDYVQFRFKRKP